MIEIALYKGEVQAHRWTKHLQQLKENVVHGQLNCPYLAASTRPTALNASMQGCCAVRRGGVTPRSDSLVNTQLTSLALAQMIQLHCASHPQFESW